MSNVQHKDKRMQQALVQYDESYQWFLNFYVMLVYVVQSQTSELKNKICFLCVHFPRGFSPPGVAGFCSTKQSHDLISCCQAQATLTDAANTRHLVSAYIYKKNIMSIAQTK